ncbi:hypothetical protein VDG1235_717 [Verrucomicrobiia bacterium DG1235]|nr:hypothetical protein VDG1235_717 [Verrucomicrobiae bacterium DG1235]
MIHSSLASTQREQSVSQANKSLIRLREQLLSGRLLILTLGSSWVYEIKDNPQAVAHNHKLPLDRFNKSLISHPEISKHLARAIKLIRAENEDIDICLTVSPVRHLRDGLRENNLSKAHLLLAAHQLETEFEHISYFPAYELLIDELRDYRFYKEDLAHPSKQATDYIWRCFSETFLTDTCRRRCGEIESVLAALTHRPHHPDTKSYQLFKEQIAEKIGSLTSQSLDCAPLQKELDQLP